MVFQDSDIGRLTELKTQFIESLGKLDFTSEEITAFPPLADVSALRNRCTRELEDFWQFLAEHQEQSIVALVGMVDAGKSSVGNLLLGREQFAVAAGRETTHAQMVCWEENTLLIDLPGLGSVLEEEDDQVVRRIVRRSSVLVLVMSIKQPIPQHLYEFLQTEVLATGLAQRVVVVVNKVDTLDDLPEALRELELEDYVSFLLHGDPDKGFEGIARLFDYELPVVSLSARSHLGADDTAQADALHDAIADAKRESTHSARRRALDEIARSARRFVPIGLLYSEIATALNSRIETLNQARDQMQEAMNTAVATGTTAFVEESHRVIELALSAMAQAERTNGIQRFLGGDSPEYNRKSRGLREMAAGYQKQLDLLVDRHCRNLADILETIIEAHLLHDVNIEAPETEAVHKTEKDVIDAIWDFYDDVCIGGKERSAKEMDTRLHRLVGLYFNEVEQWLKRLTIVADAAVTEVNEIEEQSMAVPLSVCAKLEPLLNFLILLEKQDAL